MGFYSHISLWLRRFQATLYHLLDFANSIPPYPGKKLERTFWTGFLGTGSMIFGMNGTMILVANSSERSECAVRRLA
jgi:hypothetical protein